MPIIILLWILLFVVSYALIYYSADKFIDYLKDLSILLKVSPFLIGLLILGIDPEESIVSIIAAINGLPNIAIGNVIGNSIISIAFCFSLPAIFSNLKFEKISLFYPLLIILSTIMILISTLIPYNMIFVGVVSLLIFGIYLTRNLIKYKKSKIVDIIIEDDDDDDEIDEENGENQRESTRTRKKAKLITKIIFFFILILIGGEGLIFATENILSETAIDESFFGFIIIAFVTNVEEITLLFKSIKKNQTSIGIGGMIGKIIWNMGFTLGISALIIMEIPFTLSIICNTVLFLILGLFFTYLINKRQITKKDGIILSLGFILFLILNIILGF